MKGSEPAANFFLNEENIFSLYKKYAIMTGLTSCWRNTAHGPIVTEGLSFILENHFSAGTTHSFIHSKKEVQQSLMFIRPLSGLE